MIATLRPPLVAALRLFVASCLAALVALPAHAAPRTLLVIGDSISAGYGLAAGTGWVSLLEGRLADRKLDWHVVNASISGDTTAGGLARLPALLAREKPSVVVIELGGNDGLRGSDLTRMQNNLDAMTSLAQKAGARVLLVGMQLPPNYGAAYVKRFASLYADVAKAHHAPLVPFLFEGFAERDDWFQADRIHPAPVAQQRMLDNVWPYLAPLLTGKP
ncbi:MAG: arylesterase [Proteobacteria bacterium]|nr:arylesterase [Pseudomonadota bacterium]